MLSISLPFSVRASTHGRSLTCSTPADRVVAFISRKRIARFTLYALRGSPVATVMRADDANPEVL
jgi:hypothetical protein